MDDVVNNFKRAEVKLGDDIKEMLIKYTPLINKIEYDMKDELTKGREYGIGTELDNIFILRFLLSAESYQESIDNLSKTIKWRMEKKEILEKIWKDKCTPNHHIFERFQVVGWAGSLSDGHPIFIVRSGLTDTKGLMSSVSHEMVVENLIYNNELGFQKSNKATRINNKLCKVIGIMDLNGFSLFNGRSDNRFFKCLGEASKMSEILFPQLQGKSVFVNLPSTMKIMMRIVHQFLSKRTIEKQVFCPAQNTANKNANDCPFLRNHGGIDQIPSFLGGTMKCPEYLQDIEQRKDQTIKLKVGSGKIEIINMDIHEKDIKIHYEILVESSSLDILMKIDDIILIPIKKLSSNDGLFQGDIVIPIIGKLVLEFNNSANWTARNVQYMLVAEIHSTE